MFVSFACSKQGSSHIKNNKPCEDSSGCFENKAYNTHIAIVADGHGGDKYFRSKFGSALAVESAHEVIDRFIEYTGENKTGFFDADAKNDPSKTSGNLKKTEEKIVSAWRKKVLQHIQDNPWTDDEKDFCKKHTIVIKENDEHQMYSIYGSTLLAAVVTENFWFVLQIGDGACVIIHKNGKAEIAVPDDEEQGFGVTKSLCNTDALENFRHNFGFEKIIGATVVTDGVSDSFPPETYLEFNVIELLQNFVKQPEETKKELQESLPQLSERGSGDDVSIAGIFNQAEAKPLIDRIVSAVKIRKKIKDLETELDAAKREYADLHLPDDTAKNDLSAKQDTSEALPAATEAPVPPKIRRTKRNLLIAAALLLLLLAAAAAVYFIIAVGKEEPPQAETTESVLPAPVQFVPKETPPPPESPEDSNDEESAGEEEEAAVDSQDMPEPPVPTEPVTAQPSPANSDVGEPEGEPAGETVTEPPPDGDAGEITEEAESKEHNTAVL
ncbi:MAG: protein phosphatase 2C domain-containing protein [Oscillospiraceae bacterium]|nr:protein phosphatase 2C domain-containing protein [Oscillospiraceae bacterium]